MRPRDGSHACISTGIGPGSLNSWAEKTSGFFTPWFLVPGEAGGFKMRPHACSGASIGPGTLNRWAEKTSGELTSWFLVKMGHKRPFGDEESYKLAFKHPRQLEFSNQLSSFVEILPCNDAPQKPHASGEGGFCKPQGDERTVNDTSSDLLLGIDKEFEISVPGSISSLSWVTSSTSEEDARSGAAANLSFYPEYSVPNYPVRALVQSEEIYSCLLDYPPRRPVSVGPDHQADVFVWGQDSKNSFGYADKSVRHIAFPQSLVSDVMVNEDNEEKLMGTCVIAMPDSEPSADNGDKVGDGKTDCSCLHGGSVGCVRLHVMEAREKLRRTLGQERFVELGFCDMGEEVAWKWSEEEEQVFHEVVLSNPASMGRNFWDHLSVVFPSRAKKDLVSYYFNVFMLRRRAEQNRSDPLNIDSDNDEWQESDDGDDELGMTEEEEDSVVESLVDQDDPGYNQDHEEELHEDDEDGNETCDNNEDVDVHIRIGRGVAGEEDDGGVDNVSEANVGKVQLPGKIPLNDGEDHDVQDDSCTSYECQPNRGNTYGPVDTGAAMQGNRVEGDHSKHLQDSYDGLSYGGGHGYVMESCDAKVWDIGYPTGPNKDIDFLPTCNMIAEVFGEEAWNNKDGKGIS
ncbi:hypothetical protein HHK36_007326 [Tetracentron sinense]|uniref:Myb-like domain-containing protein n=1 Tax=Tetracentron sinense TaxID=13715 RepID=A0A835DPT8_TETSI|nr:hypothetical protein HHK36_007326 [Tetracentron sinense]